MNNVLEALGFLLLIGFSYFVWPPAVLLVAGVLLVVTAAARERAARRQAAQNSDRPVPPGLAERLLAALVAARTERR